MIRPAARVAALEADGVGRVGDDLVDDLLALGRVGGERAHRGHEGGILQGQDGGVGVAPDRNCLGS
jgi:hypothetical protein